MRPPNRHLWRSPGLRKTPLRLYGGSGTTGFGSVRQTTTENLMGEKEPPREAILEDLALGPITALTMDTEGKTVYAGTETGQLAVWTLDENCSVVPRRSLRTRAATAR